MTVEVPPYSLGVTGGDFTLFLDVPAFGVGSWSSWISLVSTSSVGEAISVMDGFWVTGGCVGIGSL